MKKFLALMLALTLLCGSALAESAPADSWTCPGCGQVNTTRFCGNCGKERPEASVDGAFVNSMMAWLGGLNLAANDYSAAFSADGETFSGTLRQSGNVVELSIDELGKAQITEDALIVQAMDQTYVVDAAAFIEAIEAQAAAMEQLGAGSQILENLLQKAVSDILLPCVQYTEYNGRVTLHIKTDDVELTQRLYDFMDSVVKDTASLQALLDTYGAFLRASIPDLPETAAEIQAAWAALGKPNISNSPVFAIEGDLMVAPSKGSYEVTMSGEVRYYSNRYGFNMDYMPDYDGFSLSARLNATSPYAARGVQSYTLQLDCHNEQLNGSLLIAGPTTLAYHINAYAEDEALHAILTSRAGDSYNNWDLKLDASVNSDAGSFNALLDFVEYDDSSLTSSSTTHLASLNGSVWNSGMNAVLTIMDAQFNLRVVEGENYMRASLNAMGGNINYDFNLWLYPQYEGGVKGRLEGSSAFSGRTTAQWAVEGSYAPGSIAIQYEDKLRGGTISAKAHYLTRGSRVDMGFEYLNTIYARQLGGWYNPKEVPNKVQIVVDNTSLTADFSFVDGSVLAEGSARMVASETGIASLDATLTRTDMYAAYSTGSDGLINTLTFNYVPGKAVLSDGRESYTLLKTADTASKLEYTITYSESPDPVVLTFSLVGGKFTANMTLQGQSLASAEIAPIAKAPIVPIDTTNAFVINPETLEELLTQIAQSDTGAVPDDVYYPVEDAAESPVG